MQNGCYAETPELYDDPRTAPAKYLNRYGCIANWRIAMAVTFQLFINISTLRFDLKSLLQDMDAPKLAFYLVYVIISFHSTVLKV